MSSVATITSDLGTESGLPALPRCRFSWWFPYLQPRDVADVGLLAEGQGAHDDPELDVGNVVFIPGAMHILGSASRDILEHTVHFDEIHQELSAVCNFLHDGLCRKHFISTCLSGAFWPLSQRFSTRPWTLVDWRWEAI